MESTVSLETLGSSVSSIQGLHGFLSLQCFLWKHFSLSGKATCRVELHMKPLLIAKLKPR